MVRELPAAQVAVTGAHHGNRATKAIDQDGFEGDTAKPHPAGKARLCGRCVTGHSMTAGLAVSGEFRGIDAKQTDADGSALDRVTVDDTGGRTGANGGWKWMGAARRGQHKAQQRGGGGRET